MHQLCMLEFIHERTYVHLHIKEMLQRWESGNISSVKPKFQLDAGLYSPC